LFSLPEIPGAYKCVSAGGNRVVLGVVSRDEAITGIQRIASALDRQVCIRRHLVNLPQVVE